MIAEANGGPLNPQGFLQLPAILNNAPLLRSAIEELSSRQATLRSEQQYLTDANPRIKQLKEAVRVLEQETIPGIARNVLMALRAREPELNTLINQQSQELRGIPFRATEEARLMRQVAASENLYSSLKARYEEGLALRGGVNAGSQCPRYGPRASTTEREQRATFAAAGGVGKHSACDLHCAPP